TVATLLSPPPAGPPVPTLFPYTTLFRSASAAAPPRAATSRAIADFIIGNPSGRRKDRAPTAPLAPPPRARLRHPDKPPSQEAARLAIPASRGARGMAHQLLGRAGEATGLNRTQRQRRR